MRRREFLAATGILLSQASGCIESRTPEGQADLVWGRHGFSQGRFFKPRAIAIDSSDLIYIVDMMGRIQVFDTEGRWQREWRTPQIERGKPCGLGIGRDGSVLVGDTHYYRVLMYTAAGQLLDDRTIGGTSGREPGQFGFVTDVVQDDEGCYYVGEYGDNDRIQKFSPDGQFITAWGSHGDRPGQLIRPQGLELDGRGHLWVADACNHRVQVLDVTCEPPKLVACWGQFGTRPGQLRFPYGICLDRQGHVYLSEFGNHRVSKFTEEGEFVASWGTSGRGEGQLYQPWGVARDSRGRLFVLDTYNHRVQRFRL